MPKPKRAQTALVLTLPKFGITVLKLLNMPRQLALQKMKSKNIANLLNFKKCLIHYHFNLRIEETVNYCNRAKISVIYYSHLTMCGYLSVLIIMHVNIFR